MLETCGSGERRRSLRPAQRRQEGPLPSTERGQYLAPAGRQGVRVLGGNRRSSGDPCLLAVTAAATRAACPSNPAPRPTRSALLPPRGEYQGRNTSLALGTLPGARRGALVDPCGADGRCGGGRPPAIRWPPPPLAPAYFWSEQYDSHIQCAGHTPATS